MKFLISLLLANIILLGTYFADASAQEKGDILDKKIIDSAIYFAESALGNYAKKKCDPLTKDEEQNMWLAQEALNRLKDDMTFSDASKSPICQKSNLGFANRFTGTVYLCKNKFIHDGQYSSIAVRNFAFVLVHETAHTVGIIGQDHDTVSPAMRFINKCTIEEQRYLNQ